jgi:hypothetical protein
MRAEVACSTPWDVEGVQLLEPGTSFLFSIATSTVDVAVLTTTNPCAAGLADRVQ